MVIQTGAAAVAAGRVSPEPEESSRPVRRPLTDLTASDVEAEGAPALQLKKMKLKMGPMYGGEGDGGIDGLDTSDAGLGSASQSLGAMWRLQQGIASPGWAHTKKKMTPKRKDKGKGKAGTLDATGRKVVRKPGPGVAEGGRKRAAVRKPPGKAPPGTDEAPMPRKTTKKKEKSETSRWDSESTPEADVAADKERAKDLGVDVGEYGTADSTSEQGGAGAGPAPNSSQGSDSSSAHEGEGDGEGAVSATGLSSRAITPSRYAMSHVRLQSNARSKGASGASWVDGGPHSARGGGGSARYGMHGHPFHGAGITSLVDELEKTADLSVNAMDRELAGGNARRGARWRRFSGVGTTAFLAPEVVAGTGHGYASDYWALGVLMFQCLTGKTPFRVKGDTQQTYRNILKGKMTWPKGTESRVSVEAKQVLKILLTLDPSKRVGHDGPELAFERLREHPWFVKHKIDWRTLHVGKGPFVPMLQGCLDTGYFEQMDGISDFAFSGAYEESAGSFALG